MRGVQLLQDVLRPPCDLLPTATALQVLGGHEVPAIDVEHPPDRLVQAARSQALTGPMTVGLLAQESDRPHAIGHPQAEGAGEEGVRGRRRLTMNRAV